MIFYPAVYKVAFAEVAPRSCKKVACSVRAARYELTADKRKTPVLGERVGRCRNETVSALIGNRNYTAVFKVCFRAAEYEIYVAGNPAVSEKVQSLSFAVKLILRNKTCVSYDEVVGKSVFGWVVR